MQIACEIPCRWLDLEEYTDYSFLIAQVLLSHPELIPYYKRLDKYKILDNGTYEGKSIEIDDYLKLAKEINADEIIAFDELNDAEVSVKKTLDFMWSLSTEDLVEFKFQVVIHGKTLEEAICSYQQLCYNGDVIGFAKNITQRIELCNKLISGHSWNWMKPHHFLGLQTFQDLYFPHIRSVDTTFPICFAYDGIDFTQYTMKSIFEKETIRPPGYFDLKLEKGFLIAKRNIRVMKTISYGSMQPRHKRYNFSTHG